MQVFEKNFKQISTNFCKYLTTPMRLECEWADVQLDKADGLPIGHRWAEGRWQ